VGIRLDEEKSPRIEWRWEKIQGDQVGIGTVYFTMSLSSLMNFTVFVVCDSVVISL